ncbi:MAG: hypothetical protein ACD_80C00111G0009 [uncultured bacterium (gcode 4)]|uniref:Uncharacterized protein n=1 Tax=uncultured bacterium (gcode 4) TaxID=1234023 RepID=K1XJ01_9BACT|nr:MAG: hypothetical protein ACD_80C00111G0009 [uncultured bacterium (gcode 4)]
MQEKNKKRGTNTFLCYTSLYLLLFFYRFRVCDWYSFLIFFDWKFFDFLLYCSCRDQEVLRGYQILISVLRIPWLLIRFLMWWLMFFSCFFLFFYLVFVCFCLFILISLILFEPPEMPGVPFRLIYRFDFFLGANEFFDLFANSPCDWS